MAIYAGRIEKNGTLVANTRIVTTLSVTESGSNYVLSGTKQYLVYAYQSIQLLYCGGTVGKRISETGYTTDNPYLASKYVWLNVIESRTSNYYTVPASKLQQWVQVASYTWTKTIAKSEFTSSYMLMHYSLFGVSDDDAYDSYDDVGTALRGYVPYSLVSYNANGGSKAPAVQVKTHSVLHRSGTETKPSISGTDISLSNAIPAYEANTFMRWNTEADDSGTTYQPGATYSANAALTLYAIWWENPSVSSVTATRCDPAGNPDESGGYVKVAFDWSVVASQQGESQTAPASFSVSVGQFSDTVVPSGTSGTYEAVLGDGTLAPDTAYVVTATVGDAHGTTTSTTALPVSQEYFPPRVSATCVRVNSEGVADVLGKYFKVTANYAVYSGASGTVPQSLAIEARENGQHGSTAVLDTYAETSFASASGTVVHTFGPYDYTVLDPNTGYNQASSYTSDGLFTATLSDSFNSSTSAYELHTEGYVRPSVTSITSYRTSKVTHDGVTTYVETDEGTNCRVEVGWTVLSSGTSSQSNPTSVSVALVDVEGGTTVATRSVAFQPVDAGASNPLSIDVFYDSQQQGDVPFDPAAGELLDVARRYRVDVIVSDLYTDEVEANKAKGSDTLTPAFFTMDFLAGGHGVGIGGAATRKMLDVHMPAQFDDGTRVSELFSLPVYFYIGAAPSESQIPVKPCLLVPLNTVLQDGTQGSYSNDPSVWLCYEQPHYTMYVLESSGWEYFQDQRAGVGGSSTKDFEWELAPGKYRIDVTGVDRLEMQAKCTDGSVTVYEADSTSLVHAQISSSEYADVSVGYLYYVSHRVYVDYVGEGTANLFVTGGMFWEHYLSI